MDRIKGYLNRHTAWSAAKILLALILAVAVFSQTSLRELVAVAQRISLGWLLVGIVMFLATVWLMAYRYWLFFRRHLPLGRMLEVVIVQNNVATFIASGAGVVSYVATLRVEYDIPVTHAVAALLLARAGDVGVALITIALSSWALWPELGALHGLIGALLMGLATILAIILASIALRHRAVGAFAKLFRLLNMDTSQIAKKSLEALQALASQDMHQLNALLSPFLICTVLMTATSMAWVYSILRSFGVPIGVWPSVFVTSLTQVSAIVPIQVLGGLGVFEMTSLYLYQLLGFERSVVVPALVGLRIVLYATTLLTLSYIPLAAWMSRRNARTNANANAASPSESPTDSHRC